MLARELMEIEVAQHVGAEKFERGAERTGERNGYRDRSWTHVLAASSCACRVCVTAGNTRRGRGNRSGCSVPLVRAELASDDLALNVQQEHLGLGYGQAQML